MTPINEVPYPFFRATVYLHDAEVLSWRPGTYNVNRPYETCVSVADGMGAMLVTLVSTHKPGRYPERVFFVRRWRDPDGREFGKTRLRMTTTAAFQRMLAGYRYEYELVGAAVEPRA